MVKLTCNIDTKYDMFIIEGYNMITEFVEKIAQFNNFENVENQYSNNFKYNIITRNNLIQYMKIMLKMKPATILIGEAPGYNGCRWSGVPFTAEKNILIEYRKGQLFGITNGFKIRDIAKPQSEASATIVWEHLRKIDSYPLMWNAFPFHPHKKNNTESNRKPSNEELHTGKLILSEILKMYNINNIIALGNTAQETLAKIGITCNKIRHPANGGENEFSSGLNTELGILPSNAST